MSQVDVFLIRGLARESAHWGEFYDFIKNLNDVASVTGLDLLGAGRYHKLTSPLSIKENSEFLISQIDSKSHRPRVVVSISLGSMVAIEMAQLQPSLFAKVFVTNTSFSNLSPIHHRLQLDAFKRFYKVGRAGSLQEREMEVLSMVSRQTGKHKAIAQQWAEIAKERPMPLKNFFRQLIAAGAYRLADRPPDVPIVVLRSLGDQMVDPVCSKQLADHWSLPLHTHPSAGHDIFIDDPEWALKVISDNIKEL